MIMKKKSRHFPTRTGINGRLNWISQSSNIMRISVISIQASGSQIHWNFVLLIEWINGNMNECTILVHADARYIF